MLDKGLVPYVLLATVANPVRLTTLPALLVRMLLQVRALVRFALLATAVVQRQVRLLLARQAHMLPRARVHVRCVLREAFRLRLERRCARLAPPGRSSLELERPHARHVARELMLRRLVAVHVWSARLVAAAIQLLSPLARLGRMLFRVRDSAHCAMLDHIRLREARRLAQGVPQGPPVFPVRLRQPIVLASQDTTGLPTLATLVLLVCLIF